MVGKSKSANSNSNQPPSVRPRLKEQKGKLEVSSSRLNKYAKSTKSRRGLIAADTPAAPPSVTELARGLGYNVDNIYEWVYSNADFYPMWGLHKGAFGTLVDKVGGAFDLANLMVSLLQTSGYSTNFVFGTIRVYAADLEQWLGTDDSVVSTSSVDLLNAGQIPNTPKYDDDGDLEYVDVSHVWVQVTIDGTQYVFDPSYKTYTYTSGIDIGSVLEYDASALIDAAQSGATVTADSITNLNAANIQSNFLTYGSNLLSWIKTNNFAASMDEIIGGRDIQSLSSEPVRQIVLPNQTPGSTPVFMASIPSADFATFRVQMSGMDQTYQSAEIYGQRLSLEFNDSFQPVLTLNGEVSSTGDVLTVDTFADVTFTITHPFDTTTYNKTWTQSIYVIAGAIYNLSNAWGPSSQGMADYHRWLMQYNMASGGADTDEDVLGESLATIFFMNSAQRSQVQAIYNQLGETIHLVYHFAGITGYNGLLQSPYFDMGGIEMAVQSLVGDSATAQNVLLASEVVGNGLTAGILQQNTLGTGINAERMLELGNAASQTIYDANSSNWSSISGELTNWDDYLSSLNSLISDGYRIIIQQDGLTSSGSGESFSGGGFIQILNNIAGQLTGAIAGGTSSLIRGGTLSQAVTVSSTNTSVATGPDATNTNNFEPVSADQVGLGSGAFYYKETDISLGSGNFPYSLEFTRYYNSSNLFVNSPLGPGWTHNFNTFINTGSNGLRVCGEFSPKEAAPSIAHAYVMIQLALNDSPSLTQLLIASESTLWLMDQMTNNAVTVNDGRNSREYVLLVDGTSYNPAPGYSDTLTISDELYTLRNPQNQQWSFNSNNFLATYADPSSISLDYSYDEGTGLLASVINAFGRAFYFSYSGTQLSIVTSSDERGVPYTFDEFGNLSGVEGLSSGVTSYIYGSLPGILTEIILPYANAIAESASAQPIPVLTNSYDSNFLVMSQTGSDTGQYSFNFAGSRTAVIDPIGNTFVRYRNSLGSVVKQINELGQETIYARDGLDRVTSITYPELNVVAFTYDNNNNVLTKTWQPKTGSGLPNIVETFTYDSTWNKLSSFEDGEGNVTSYTYDSIQGTLLTMTRPVIDGTAATVAFTYNSSGQILTKTDETGLVEQFAYDSDTELISTVTQDPEGLNLVTTYTYDSAGNVATIKDPLSNTTTFYYNAVRQLISKIYPDSSAGAAWNYDYNGRLSSFLLFDGEGNNQEWNYTYLNCGLIQTITDPANAATTFEYDTMARLSRRTDSEVHSYQFSYDALSRISAITDASFTICDSRTYTNNGMLASRQDASANVTSYQYDGFDRLSTQTYADTTFEQYTYDDNGNLLTLITRKGDTITNTYDALNRLSTRQAGSLSLQTMTYDLAGRLTGVSTPAESTPGSGAYGFTYDTAGRLYVQTMPNGDTVTYELDNNGNRISLTWPDSYSVEYSYDNLNRLSEITLPGASAWAAQFQYDGFSRRTEISYSNGCQCTYTYALNNDLKWQDHSFVGSSAHFGYSYNTVHQVTSLYLDDDSFFLEPSSPISSVYSNANSLNQYPSVDSTSYSYNGNGCLTGGLLSATFDALNRMTQGVSGSTTNDYWYDPLNRQAQKSLNGTDYAYLYDGQELIAVYDASGTLLNRFIRSDRPDEVLLNIDGSGTVYLHHDRIGSLIAETDDSGSVLNKFGYSVFGESTTSSSSGFGFTGQRYDAELGIYFYKSRYYSPTIGRFIQPDPLGYDAGDLNLYAYVNNDPLNRLDPLGLAPWEEVDSMPSSQPGFAAVAQSNLSKQSITLSNANPLTLPTLSFLPGELGKGMGTLIPKGIRQEPQGSWYLPLIPTALGARIALLANAPTLFRQSLKPTAPLIESMAPGSGSYAQVSELGQIWFTHPAGVCAPSSKGQSYYNQLWVIQNQLLPNLIPVEN